jgi:hypothetical protein
MVSALGILHAGLPQDGHDLGKLNCPPGADWGAFLGSLRFILALLVVGSHLGAFGGATFAVKAFFISGFYMALVIDTWL